MKKMVVCPKWNSQQQHFSTIFLTHHSSGESSNFTKKTKVNQIKNKLLKKCFKKRCKKDQSVKGSQLFGVRVPPNQLLPQNCTPY
jgi:hypothetical protein